MEGFLAHYGVIEIVLTGPPAVSLAGLNGPAEAIASAAGLPDRPQRLRTVFRGYLGWR